MHDQQAILILFFSFFFNCMNKTKAKKKRTGQYRQRRAIITQVAIS